MRREAKTALGIFVFLVAGGVMARVVWSVVTPRKFVAVVIADAVVCAVLLFAIWRRRTKDYGPEDPLPDLPLEGLETFEFPEPPAVRAREPHGPSSEGAWD